jgi:hypothetical protein
MLEHRVYVTCVSVVQGEQEYEMRVKLYDEVDSEQSRWEILSTKVRSPHTHRALQVVACTTTAHVPCCADRSFPVLYARLMTVATGCPRSRSGCTRSTHRCPGPRWKPATRGRPQTGRCPLSRPG